MEDNTKKEDFNARGIIANAGGRRRKLEAYSPTTNNPPEETPDYHQMEVIPEPEEPMKEKESPKEPEPPREEPRRRKTKQEQQSYVDLFFKESSIKTRSGKVVYIRKEYHDRILKVVRVIGENEFSLFSYLDNVLEHHFNTFQDEMTEAYNKKDTNLF